MFRFQISMLLMPTPKPFCWIAFLLLAWPLFPPPVFGCAPPPPNTFGSQQKLQQHAAVISPRQATQQGVGLVVAGIDRASALSGPVRVPEELYCYDFDDKCRWRNMEGLLVDELDWYQGGGTLDENRLKLATGTHLTPEGFYGIAATDKVEFGGAKAILVSDVIECQRGTAHLRFMYWTSPEVKITVCVKSVLRLFPYFDYCSKPIENDDPGPAFLTLPEINEPMQIFIQAQNFVFNSAALQGGFAIIDNLEYYGEFCEDGRSFDQFARSAPSQSALRPGFQQQMLQQQQHLQPVGPTGFPPNSAPESTAAAGGPYEGFRSLLEWMLYGNGLARQQSGQGIQELLLNSTGSQMEHQTETVAPPPPAPPQQPLTGTEQAQPLPTAPTLLPQQQQQQQLQNSLRSINIVQRQRGPLPTEEQELEQEAEAENEENKNLAIQNSILLGQSGAATTNRLTLPHIRRPQPHLELLARKRGKQAQGHGVEEAEEEKVEEEMPPAEEKNRALGEEGMGEEEQGPSQVEREEWVPRGRPESMLFMPNLQ